MMEVTAFCPHCKNPLETSLSENRKCPECDKNVFEYCTDRLLENRSLDQCPVCGAQHLYQQKDFNRKIGVLLVVVGVLFAYWTYGVSLLLAALFDFVLYRAVPYVGLCYKCHAQFRKSELVASLPHFNLSLFDYYKNLAEAR